MNVIKEQSVVLLIGQSANDATALAIVSEALFGGGPARILTWDINHPGETGPALDRSLSEDPRAIVLMKRYHSKAIKDTLSAAKRHGAYHAIVAGPDVPEVSNFEILQANQPVEIVPIPLDRRDDQGPFDIIGDIHGCAWELMSLLEKLGYVPGSWEELPAREYHAAVSAHHEGRKVILLGDLVDRGPENLATLRIAQRVEELGGFRVLGNHDDKVARWAQGRNVTPSEEMATTTCHELNELSEEERRRLGEWLSDAEAHYLLDGGRLAVAHAGIDQKYQGRNTRGARSFALYGPSYNDQYDQDGYPLRIDWAKDYAGETTVVHGHVVYGEPNERNKVVAVDTGCVFGGSLTAYRWPEQTYVSVKAQRNWCDRENAADG